MDQERPDDMLDERALSKLKWRCRRGLLENDLFIERFFQRHEAGLTRRHAQALSALMDLPDNDLLDLLLKRREPTGEEAGGPDKDVAEGDVREVLEMLRN